MTTIILPDWFLWFAVLIIILCAALSATRLWLCIEIRKVCENRLFDQDTVRRILGFAETGKR